MVRGLLWKGAEADLFRYKVPVTNTRKMSVHIKKVAKDMGADLVGVTYLHPAFVFEDDETEIRLNRNTNMPL
jgi:hypothetical protein